MAKKKEKVVKSGIPWWLILLQGIFAIILGLLLLAAPGMTTLVMVQFIGIYWLVSGIFGIVSIFMDKSRWGWKLFSGALGIIAGILILGHPLWSAVLVPTTLVILMGIQGIVFGVVGLIQAFQGGGWGPGILGALAIIVGLYLLGSPLLGALVLPWVVGIFMLVGGIVAIVQAFRIK